VNWFSAFSDEPSLKIAKNSQHVYTYDIYNVCIYNRYLLWKLHTATDGL
jgi:hypothetical protein